MVSNKDEDEQGRNAPELELTTEGSEADDRPAGPRVHVDPAVIEAMVQAKRHWDKEISKTLATIEPAISQIAEQNWSKLSFAVQQVVATEFRVQEIARQLIQSFPWDAISSAATMGAEILEAAWPDNWRGIPAEKLDRLYGLIDEVGWCLIWVPRRDIVEEVAELSIDEAAELIVRRRRDIVEDVRDLSGHLTRPEIADLREGIVDAASALEHGSHRSAQALAATLITTMVQGHVGHKTLGKARSKFLASHPDDAPISNFRLTAILYTVGLSLEQYWPSDETPVPKTFNRHASVHTYHPDQFTELNSIIGLILATAFARELQAFYVATVEAA